MDMYVDKDVWSYLLSCKLAMVDSIKLHYKVQLNENVVEDMMQICVVSNGGTPSDTKEAYDSLRQICENLQSELVKEFLTLQTYEKKKKLLEITANFEDVYVYESKDERDTFVFLGEGKDVKAARSKIRKKLGILPFRQQHEISELPDDKYETPDDPDMAPDVNRKHVGHDRVIKSQFTREEKIHDEEILDGCIPKKGASVAKKATVEGTDDMDALFEDTKTDDRRTSDSKRTKAGGIQERPAMPKRETDVAIDELFSGKSKRKIVLKTPGQTKADHDGIKEDSVDDVTARLIQDILDSGDPNAEQRINEIFEGKDSEKHVARKVPESLSAIENPPRVAAHSEIIDDDDDFESLFKGKFLGGLEALIHGKTLLDDKIERLSHDDWVSVVKGSHPDPPKKQRRTEQVFKREDFQRNQPDEDNFLAPRRKEVSQRPVKLDADTQPKSGSPIEKRTKSESKGSALSANHDAQGKDKEEPDIIEDDEAYGVLLSLLEAGEMTKKEFEEQNEARMNAKKSTTRELTVTDTSQKTSQIPDSQGQGFNMGSEDDKADDGDIIESIQADRGKYSGNALREELERITKLEEIRERFQKGKVKVTEKVENEVGRFLGRWMEKEIVGNKVTPERFDREVKREESTEDQSSHSADPQQRHQEEVDRSTEVSSLDVFRRKKALAEGNDSPSQKRKARDESQCNESDTVISSASCKGEPEDEAYNVLLMLLAKEEITAKEFEKQSEILLNAKRSTVPEEPEDSSRMKSKQAVRSEEEEFGLPRNDLTSRENTKFTSSENEDRHLSQRLEEVKPVEDKDEPSLISHGEKHPNKKKAQVKSRSEAKEDVVATVPSDEISTMSPNHKADQSTTESNHIQRSKTHARSGDQEEMHRLSDLQMPKKVAGLVLKPKKTITMAEFGVQPADGVMKAVKVKNESLPGHKKDGCFVEMTFTFPRGTQKEGDPNPGTAYPEMRYTIYLPGSEDGKQVASLINKAYKARKLFKIEGNLVVWNGFTPKVEKSGQFGYPDPGYLNAATGELNAILNP